MTGASTTRERSLRGNANHPNRRSFIANGNLTPKDLAVLTEVDDEDDAATPQAEVPTRTKVSRSNTPDGAPPVPALPTTPSRTPEPPSMTENKSARDAVTMTSSRISIFLQLGREVKKVVVEPSISFASLRVLFVDKFAYNPGLENFPAIYIRDPSSGVQYELEDTDEVKDKSVLSLNIERMHQILGFSDSSN